MVRRRHGHGDLWLLVFKGLGTAVGSNLPNTDVIPGGLLVNRPGFIQRRYFVGSGQKMKAIAHVNVYY